MPMTTVIVPPSRSAAPSTFSDDMDLCLAQLPAFASEANALETNVNAKEASATAAAVTAASDAANADASAALAALYAGAIAWVSGTFAMGDRRWAPLNGRLYRRLTAGTGATDPSLDPTGWAVVSAEAPVQLVSALVQLAIAGSAYAFTNSATQGAGTNQYLNTDRFDLWTQGGATISANATMGPDGTVTADKIVEDAGAGSHFIYKTSTAAFGARSDTVCVKAAGRTTLIWAIDKDGLGVDGYSAVFNLTAVSVGVITNIGVGVGSGATIVHLGDGWYECSISGTPHPSVGTSIRSVIYPNGSLGYVGDGVSGLYVAQDHGEAGAKTSFIASGATAGTRPSGVVAPQRLVMPAAPAANDWLRVVPANGITTNVIDPNGQTIEGVAGPVNLDDGTEDLQFINGTWRFMK